MRTRGFYKGMLDFYDTNGPKNGLFVGVRKLFRETLDELHVPFIDLCCPDVTIEGGFLPVGFLSGGLSYFDPATSAWVSVDSAQSVTALTAHAGGGQALGTQLAAGFNEVTVVATAGDSVKLPAAAEGLVVIVKNDGATAADVFPATADTINDAAVNVAVRIAPGSSITFTAINAVNWETSNQVVAVADGTAAIPSFSFSTQPNLGFYKLASNAIGASVGGAVVGGFTTTGAISDVIVELTPAAGVTVDSVLLKDGGVSNAAVTQIAGFFPLTAAQALSGAGAVNVTAYLTKYTSTGAAQALTLASGTQIGQRKKVSHVVDGGSGILTAVYVGGTTITFTTVGEFADLLWTGAAWAVLELGNSATPGTPPALA